MSIQKKPWNKPGQDPADIFESAVKEHKQKRMTQGAALADDGNNPTFNSVMLQEGQWPMGDFTFNGKCKRGALTAKEKVESAILDLITPTLIKEYGLKRIGEFNRGQIACTYASDKAYIQASAARMFSEEDYCLIRFTISAMPEDIEAIAEILRQNSFTPKNKKYSDKNFRTIHMVEYGYGLVDDQVGSASSTVSRAEEYFEAKEFDEVREGLYPKIKIDELTRQYLESDANFLLLHGPAGTGKTSLTKYIIRALSTKRMDGEDGQRFCHIALVKDARILKDRSFYTWLKRDNIEMIILDDFNEEFFDGRFDDKGKKQDTRIVDYLNSQLNGIIRNKVKIVVTTNKPIDQIDPSLLREGRTKDILRIPPLTWAEGLTEWMAMGSSKETFIKEFGEKPDILITQGSLMARHERQTVFKGADYLLDESISSLREFTQRFLNIEEALSQAK